MQYPTISEYVKAIQDAGDNLDMSTEATNAELNEAITDEFGVKYSKDGRKILEAPKELDGTYSIRKETKIICDCAFGGCYSLRSLVLPDGVTRIGDSAFDDCSSLSSIVIPDSVTSIGDGAFLNCCSLTSIVLPDSVTSIGDSAFEGCTSLTSLVIPDSVTSIGDKAFYRCSSLTSFVIPNGVTRIGTWTFLGCSSLKEVAIPDSVSSIGEWAFSDCSSLKYISIPKNVICLNGNPFFNWYGKLECLSPNFIYEDDVLFNKDKSKIISCRVQGIRSYIIPSSVTSIGNYAFDGCDFLSDIVIPTSVTNIGRGAFRGCNFPTDLKQELISRFGGKIFG